MIKNIIFDMGGVLFKLNPERCISAFETIGANKTAVYVKECRTEDLFHMIEVGNGTTDDFCNEVRKLDGLNVTNDEIIDAWNALLDSTSDHKRTALKQLKKEGYRLFLLSNTNHMHWHKAANELIPAIGESVDDYFEKIFLSYEMGMRKPDTSIFQMAVDAAGLNPEETIFIDDSELNLKGAASIGLNTFHETTGHRWTELLKKAL